MSASRRTNPARRGMFEAIKRACYSSYGTARLSEEVTTRLATGLDVSGVAVATTDPELGVLTRLFPHGMAPELVQGYSAAYPRADATGVLELWRSGRTVSRERPMLFDVEVGAHAGPRLHVIALDAGLLWGWLCLVRDPGAEEFSDDDGALLARLSAHVGAGLRRAALLDAAIRETPGNAAPVVLLVSDRGEVQMRGAGAAHVCDDLTGPGWNPHVPPPAVSGALARLYAIERTARPDDDSALEGRVRAQGRSGGWYEVTASRAEGGCGSAIVVIAAVRAEGRLDVLARLYGLSPREREVVQHVARGRSTKAIARALDLSPYTVQEHIGRASEKVGVRGRRELVARLLLS